VATLPDNPATHQVSLATLRKLATHHKLDSHHSSVTRLPPVSPNPPVTATPHRVHQEHTLLREYRVHIPLDQRTQHNLAILPQPGVTRPRQGVTLPKRVILPKRGVIPQPLEAFLLVLLTLMLLLGPPLEQQGTMELVPKEWFPLTKLGTHLVPGTHPAPGTHPKLPTWLFLMVNQVTESSQVTKPLMEQFLLDTWDTLGVV